MSLNVDCTTLVTLVAALVTLCYGLQYWDKKQANLLESICKGLFSEIAEEKSALLEKAKSYGVNRYSKGKGQQLHRCIGVCSAKYQTPHFMYFISGAAVVSTIYCLFIIAIPFIVGSNLSEADINYIVVVGQMVLLTMFLPWLLFKCDHILVVRWNLKLIMLTLIVLALSSLMVLCNVYFHVFGTKMMMNLYRLSAGIPFIPIVLSMWFVYRFYCGEKKKYRELQVAVCEYEKSIIS